MKRLIFIILFPSVSWAVNVPEYNHKDPIIQLEFQNVGFEIQKARSASNISSSTLPSGSTHYIQNTKDLQASSQFNVSSGTIQGQLNLRNGSITQTFTSGAPFNQFINQATSAGSEAALNIQTESAATGAADPYLQLKINGGSTWVVGVDNSDSDAFKIDKTNLVGGDTAIKVTTDGEITQPLQPSFLATAPSNTANVTGNGTDATGEYDTEIFDQGSDFNTGTYTFTAPVTGRYSFSLGIQWTGASAVSFGNARFVTSNRNYNVSFGSRSTVDGISHSVTQVDMDANDTCLVNWSLSGGTLTAEATNDASYNYFSGALIN
jgi:hypothetical protein